MNQPPGTAASPAQAGQHAEFVQQLDAILDELSQLAQTAVRRSDFYPPMLARVVVATQSAAAAVWSTGPGGQWLPAFSQQLAELQAGVRPEKIAAEREQLQACAGSEQDRAVLAGAHDGSLIALPLRVAGRLLGLFTVYRSAAENPALGDGLAPLWTAVREICVEFESHYLLRAAATQGETQQNLTDLLLELHGSRDTRELAYVLANDGRVFLGCDRLSVFRVGGGARLVATSGVARVDRRSRYTRQLGRVVARLARHGQSFAYPQGLGELPPRWQQAVSEFAREQGLQAFFVVLWKTPPAAWARSRVSGAYTLEQLQPGEAVADLARLQMLERHVAIAWQNRHKAERNPLRGIGAAVGSVFSILGLDRLPRAILALLAAAGLLLALVTVQREFRLEIQGKLVPVAQPHVWAPLDGIVRRVAVQHGDQVAAGQLLVELDSPELDLELQKIRGQLRSAEVRREGYRLSLQQAEKLRQEPDADQLKLSAEIAELEAEIDSLQGEQRFLEALRQQQQIVSPRAGQVITWNVAELLANRPVRKGESLMVVGDTAGPWHVEFAVPDRTMKYIGEAQQQASEPLTIDCLVAGDPHHPFTAELSRVAPVATPGAGTDPEILVVGAVDRAQLPTVRVGLSVTGRVRCGPRSLWYIGTYELMDTIRRRLMW